MINNQPQPQDQDDDALSSLIASRSGGSGAAPAQSESDDDLSSLIQSRMNAAQPAAKAPAKRAAAEPSQYRSATRPISSSEPELSWSETGQKALQNFVPSVGQLAKSTASAFTHPTETIGALGQLGKGALSQAAGAIGVQQDPAKKAETESLLNALEDHYKQAYGSTKGFKKALSEDPASMLMDFSTVLTGGTSAVGKLATTGSTAAKIARGVGQAGAMIDPIAGSLKIAKNLVGRPVAAVARGLTSKTTGVPTSLIGLAKTAGSTADEGLRNTFNKFSKGEGTADEIHSAAEDALKSIKKRKSDEYLQAHGNIASNPIDFSLIQNSWHKAWADANKGAGFQDRVEALKEMAAMINRTPGTLEHVDALKQQIWDLNRRFPDAKEAVNELYAATRETLANKKYGGDSTYAEMMDSWQKHIRGINDLKKTLGPGSAAASTSVLAKMLKAAKTPQGETLLKTLAKERPDLMYMLSGSALSNWHPGGMRSLADALLASPWLLTGNPHGAIASIAASSPKLVGKAAYGIGAAERLGSKALASPVRTAAYQAERAQESAAPETAVPEASPQSETGYNVGNIRDKAGGFRSYETPEAAAAAVANNLRSYPDRFNGGKPMTLREIANRWAPREDNNDPDAWARNVALTAGVDPDQPIDQNDTSLMQRIIKGVHVAEHGQKKLYPDEVYARAAGPSASASGGRIERASGGKVGNAKHERIVNKLMAMASKAKKATDRTTESLLDEPDESIVKALNVAQQAI
jgi:hypothetical protein